MKTIIHLMLLVMATGIIILSPASADVQEKGQEPKAEATAAVPEVPKDGEDGKTDGKRQKGKSQIPPIKDPKLEEDPKSVKMSADRLLYDDKTKISRLRGNVKITYGTAVVTSKYAVFHSDKKEAFFTGGVILRRPQTVIKGSKMDVFYNEKRAVVSENVRAVSYQKQEKSPGKKTSSPEDESPIIMTCKTAEYLWGTEDAYVDGNVKIWKNDKRAYADHGHYSQPMGTVVLTDNVRFEQGPDNWMSCPEAVFDINAETFAAKGGVKAEVDVPENEDKGKDDGKDKKKDKKKDGKKDAKKGDNGSSKDGKDKKTTLPEDRVMLPPIMPEEDDEVIFMEDEF